MPNEKNGPKIRSRQCMFVLYPESQQKAIDYCQQNFPCAWALHDKDTHTQNEYDKYIAKHDGEQPDWKPGDLKKPHVHFVCKFANARWFASISRELGVPETTIRKVNNLYKAYVYLWHALDLDKYQYDPAIVGNHDFEEPSEHAGISQVEDEQIQILLDMPAFDTFGEMGRWAYEQGCWASFKKNYSLWRDIFLERRHVNPGKCDIPAPNPVAETFGPGMQPMLPRKGEPFTDESDFVQTSFPPVQKRPRRF